MGTSNWRWTIPLNLVYERYLEWEYIPTVGHFSCNLHCNAPMCKFTLNIAYIVKKKMEILKILNLVYTQWLRCAFLHSLCGEQRKVERNEGILRWSGVKLKFQHGAILSIRAQQASSHRGSVLLSSWGRKAICHQGTFWHGQGLRYFSSECYCSIKQSRQKITSKRYVSVESWMTEKEICSPRFRDREILATCKRSDQQRGHV